MPTRKPCFLVLESYWSDDLAERESVQPFVKGLCDFSDWEFHYRTFDSANDLDLWIANFQKIRRARCDKIIYVATHGSPSGDLHTLEGSIRVGELIRILAEAKSVVGLHLGSCSIGQPQVLAEILEKTSLHWVAAYQEEVPWLESTALDLLFWSWIYAGAPRRVLRRRLSPEAAAHELYEHFHYARQMGFRVLYRDHPGGEIISSWDTWPPEATAQAAEG
jgi:hypothetical protein